MGWLTRRAKSISISTYDVISPTERRLRSYLGGPGHHAQAEEFKPARDHILGIILLSAIALLSIGWAPKYLAWLLIVPVLCVWWVLKSRTRVSEKGIAINYAFKGSQNISWDNFAGIGFQRAKAFARTKSGKQFTLPGVTFNSLPRLSDASRGRIPDALTARRDAADESGDRAPRWSAGSHVQGRIQPIPRKHPERAPKLSINDLLSPPVSV